jgi:hypothetical protein
LNPGADGLQAIGAGFHADKERAGAVGEETGRDDRAATGVGQAQELAQDQLGTGAAPGVWGVNCWAAAASKQQAEVSMQSFFFMGSMGFIVVGCFFA